METLQRHSLPLLQNFKKAKDILIEDLLASETIRYSQIRRCPARTPFLDHVLNLLPDSPEADDFRKRVSLLIKRRLLLAVLWHGLIAKDLRLMSRLDPSDTARCEMELHLEQAIDNFKGSVKMLWKRIRKDIKRIKEKCFRVRFLALSTREEANDWGFTVSEESAMGHVAPIFTVPSPEDYLMALESAGVV